MATTDTTTTTTTSKWTIWSAVIIAIISLIISIISAISDGSISDAEAEAIGQKVTEGIESVQSAINGGTTSTTTAEE